MACSKCSDDSSEEETEDSVDVWKLDTLPKELFLHICSFLNAKFVINVLSQVCPKFKCIIDDDVTWRIRLLHQWPKLYPIVKPPDDFCWKAACCEREEQERLWCANGSKMKRYHIKGAHFAGVDVVHLIENGRFCASGARDRSLKLWNLEVLKEYSASAESIDAYQIDDRSHAENLTAHRGWIWSMAYSPGKHTLYTGSWDNNIKSWDMYRLANSTGITNYVARSPILCLSFNDNILVSGSYDRFVSFFDGRTLVPIFQKPIHHKAVLCIASDEKFVISGSEDASIIVYNRAAGKIQKVIELNEGYPMSISYTHQNLWIGDSKGYIHLVDPTEEKFELIRTFESGHKGRVTGIQYSLGSLVTCSSDKTLQILEPCDKPEPIAVIRTIAEFAGISVHRETLASANSDDSITIWMPEAED